MNKFKEIRPVVLGIAKHNNRILVSSGYDKVTNQTFYRCLGGGIEFLETSEEALKREYKEELNIDIEVENFCGIAENIFTFEGVKAHELVLFYNIKIKDNDFKEEYCVTEDREVTEAYWIDIEEFKKNDKILYPTQILKYL